MNVFFTLDVCNVLLIMNVTLVFMANTTHGNNFRLSCTLETSFQCVCVKVNIIQKYLLNVVHQQHHHHHHCRCLLVSSITIWYKHTNTHIHKLLYISCHRFTWLWWQGTAKTLESSYMFNSSQIKWNPIQSASRYRSYISTYCDLRFHQNRKILIFVFVT